MSKNIFIEGAISSEKIATSIANHQKKTNIGGHSIFLGQVRADHIDNNVVAGIEYTAHVEMANTIAHKIREEIFAKYNLTCMHVYHSLGIVNSGEICLFVFTSSAHRKPAIDACEELVERIKKELPIWGKELFSNQEYRWKENKLADE
ncbi:MAG: molybdenum cofactor biosynthesis protein MoaE [Flavobacteriales bacterium]|nr:molybdenum cofactor biosynthesis protein MoaE [Flavobacteriales bacterium]